MYNIDITDKKDVSEMVSRLKIIKPYGMDLPHITDICNAFFNDTSWVTVDPGNRCVCIHYRDGTPFSFPHTTDCHVTACLINDYYTEEAALWFKVDGRWKCTECSDAYKLIIALCKEFVRDVDVRRTIEAALQARLGMDIMSALDRLTNICSVLAARSGKISRDA